MKPTPLSRWIARVIVLAATGCTSKQAYDTGQAWQRRECNKIVDQNERDRCLDGVNTPYEDYKRQTEGSGKR